MVACRAHNPKVGGSNPPPASIILRRRNGDSEHFERVCIKLKNPRVKRSNPSSLFIVTVRGPGLAGLMNLQADHQ